MSDPRSHPYFLERTVRATVSASDREGARIELEKASRVRARSEHAGQSLARKILDRVSARVLRRTTVNPTVAANQQPTASRG